MKLVTFEVQTPAGIFERLGAIISDGRILDLNAGYQWLLRRQGQPHPARFASVLLPAEMIRFLEGGKKCLDAALETCKAAGALPPKERMQLKGPNQETVVYMAQDIRLKAPLPRPASLRDFLAFEEHAKQGAARRKEQLSPDWYEIPAYYKGNHREIYGPDAEVPWPFYTRRFDFELEIACVVGKEGRNLTPEQAVEHIAGYTLLNDFSARDIQKYEMQSRMGPAKAKDFATALGPFLVTADEMKKPADEARMIVRVNGEDWSQGRYGDRYWTFPVMLSHVSQEETIYPGDVLGSGTFYKGCGLDLDRWLKPGDAIEIEVDGLGVLKNMVGKPQGERQLRYPQRGASTPPSPAGGRD